MMQLNPSQDPEVIRMLLELCIETGADEPIGDKPINRFKQLADIQKVELTPKETVVAEVTPPPNESVGNDKAVDIATRQAENCHTLAQLKTKMAAYPYCALREVARNLVFSDGEPGAHVMLVGEAPGAEEDEQGKPFVGSSGQLLDRMFAEIGLSRNHQDPTQAIYITNVIPWRPPGNRNPSKIEIAMMSPFVKRHVEIIKPKILVAVGNFSCAVFLGKSGVTRLRGKWFEWREIPLLPLFHPAYLLRGPGRKADAWHDMLMIQRKLRDLA